MFYLPSKETEEHRLAIKNIEEYYSCSKIRQIDEVNEKLHFIKKKPIYENVLFHYTAGIEEEVSKECYVRKRKDIFTIHQWGAPIYFKPSIYEIFLQIKRREWANVAGFQIKPNENPIDEWCDIEKQAMQHGYHIGRVTLFTKKESKAQKTNTL